MIKTLLWLSLITTPVTYDDVITFSVCEELADVLMASVDDGYIKEHEAERIYKRCLANL